jgi:hypothetical protein
VKCLSTRKGRPTKNPKVVPKHVRLDRECEIILYYYTLQKNVSEAEAFRIGIRKLKSDIKIPLEISW